MTYRQVLDELRDDLIWLLSRHRTTQGLGGPGSYRVPVTSTEDERREFGVEIQRYRAVVLRYALGSLQASKPTARLTGTETRRDPVVGLLRELTRAARDLPREPALSDLLGRAPRYPLVARWQSAARSAVQAERELACLRWAEMTPPRLRVIQKDAADLARALAILEGRYLNVPGWAPFPRRTRLLRLANHAKQHLGDLALDHSVDGQGWRPHPGRIEGPRLPGLAGVLQAQHNVLVGLIEFPNALNLRKVLAEQAQLSARVATVAGAMDTGVADYFVRRSGHYRELMLAARTVGGEVGGGREAALESSFATSRVPSRLSEDDREVLRQLAGLSNRVDGRVRAAVEHGFDRRFYLVATVGPDFDGPAVRGVRRGQVRWVIAEQDPELLTVARSPLACLPRVGAVATSREVSREPHMSPVIVAVTRDRGALGR